MPEPKPAATVLLVRDGAAGVEVAMMRRSRKTGFMPAVRVYPGGRIDLADIAPAWEADYAPRAGLPLAAIVAAIRETFEEVGLLLAAGPVPEEVLGLRDQFREDEPPLPEFFAAHGLVPALDGFLPFGRWVTPEAEQKRYDTWFLLARAPAGQALRPHPAEASEGAWFLPEEVLRDADEGREFLAPPTLYTLEELAAQPDVDALFAWAAARTPPVCRPLLDYEGDTTRIILPGDALHEEKTPAYPGKATRIHYGAGRFWRS